MEFLVSNFATRPDLEREVASKIGLTADAKPDHIIKGTTKELRNLFLKHGSIFWGIKCVATDEAEKKAEKEGKKKDEKGETRTAPNRGKIHKTELEDVDINESKEA